MAILVFLGKPLLYLAAFGLLAALTRTPGEGTTKSLLGRVALATLGRIVAGGIVGALAVNVAGTNAALLFGAFVVPLGLLAWLGAAKLAFPKLSWANLVLFAVACELLSGGIDYWAWREVQTIRFC